MYDVITVPAWLSISAVVLFAVAALWVYREDLSPRPIGFAGMVLGGITTLTWFTTLAFWLNVVIMVLVVGLFLVGMRVGHKSDDKDDKWHWLAFFVGLFGKLVCGLVPIIIGAANGSVQTPKWLLFVLIVVALVGFAAAVSPRVRGLFKRVARRSDNKAASASH